MRVETIKLDALHSVRVERALAAVKLQFIVGGVPMYTKTITLEAARHLGDALGFASNDGALAPVANPGLEAQLRVGEEPPACAVRADSTWPRDCARCEIHCVVRPCGPACEAK